MKLVIFDFDGTLADTNRDIAYNVNLLRKELGYGEKTIEEITSYIGDGVNKLLERALPEYPSPENLRKKFLRVYEKNPVKYTHLYPDVRTTLSELKNRNYNLAILTNKPERIVNKILNYFGLTHIFSFVVGEDTLPVKKPASETAEFILSSTNSTRENTYIVGDGVNDMIVAKRAGVHSILVAYGYGDSEKIAKEYHPEFVIDSISELLSILPPVE